MKLPSLKIAALALASLAALAQSANAQNVTTQTGDLILGVYQTNSSATGYGNTYEVDLGSLANFGPTVTNLDLKNKVSITDLDAIFGSSLSSTSWFVAGTIGTSTVSNFPSNGLTVFNDAVLVTDLNVPGTYAHGGLSGAASTIGGLVNGLASDAHTANSTSAAELIGTTQPNGVSTNFGLASSPTSVVVADTFGSTSNFYLLDPASNSSISTTHGVTTDLGNFKFVGGTDFTFNSEVVAVPEPSTYALMGLGALLLVITARRRIASNL